MRQVIQLVRDSRSSRLKEELKCVLLVPGKEFSLRLQDMKPGIRRRMIIVR